jgi:hypothetical protein
MHRTQVLLAAVLLVGPSCADQIAPTELTDPEVRVQPQFNGSIDELKVVTYEGQSLTLWPFTGRSPSRFNPADPMNLIFLGENDPRAIRAALLFVDGNRGGPFNCTWSDAIGDVQTAYTEPGGWTANAIQLQCGAYSPLRFHLRLWDVGEWSLGGGHLEVLIPGTTDHEILNWELPEQLVALDLQRAGVIGGMSVSDPLFPSPYRTMLRAVYNGLPDQVRALIAGWPTIVPPVGDIPLLTDQRATVLELTGSVEGEPAVARQRLTFELNQVVPKPFCAHAPVYVTGTVRLDQVVVFTPAGNFVSHFHALGQLDVAPIDPQTGLPGETHRALVNQTARGIITDAVTLVSSFQIFAELPKSVAENEGLVVSLRVGPHGALDFDVTMACQ